MAEPQAKAAAQLALDAEIRTTNQINDLLTLAIAEKNYAAQNFLQWFVNEQVEEEMSADNVVQNLKTAADAPGALFMIDRELGQRVFTPPAAQGAP